MGSEMCIRDRRGSVAQLLSFGQHKHTFSYGALLLNSPQVSCTVKGELGVGIVFSNPLEWSVGPVVVCHNLAIGNLVETLPPATQEIGILFIGTEHGKIGSAIGHLRLWSDIGPRLAVVGVDGRAIVFFGNLFIGSCARHIEQVVALIIGQIKWLLDGVGIGLVIGRAFIAVQPILCLLYTSDAADE